ncbi:MAG: hypothetical protein WDN03_12670 [Rhizomicrobium sp.]
MIATAMAAPVFSGLRYVDTDEHRIARTYDSHVVGSLTFSL